MCFYTDWNQWKKKTFSLFLLRFFRVFNDTFQHLSNVNAHLQNANHTYNDNHIIDILKSKGTTPSTLSSGSLNPILIINSTFTSKPMCNMNIKCTHPTFWLNFQYSTYILNEISKILLLLGTKSFISSMRFYHSPTFEIIDDILPIILICF